MPITMSLFYGAGLLEQELATVAPQVAAEANATHFDKCDAHRESVDNGRCYF